MLYSIGHNDSSNESDGSPATDDQGKGFTALAMAMAAVMCGLAVAAASRRKNIFHR